MNIDRRTFVHTASAAALGMLVPAIDTQAGIAKTKAAAGFDLKVLATNWGYPGDLETYLAAVKKEGYDGIEIWWSDDEKGQKDLFRLLDKYKLTVGFLCGGWQND